MNKMNNPAPTPMPQRDWLGLTLTALLFGWLGITLLALHWPTWIVEQLMIVAGVNWPVWIWPVATAIHFVLLAVPLIPLALFWPHPRYRAVFQTWALAATYLLFLIPARLAPANRAQLAALLQIGGSLFYLAFVAGVIWLRRRYGGPGLVRPKAPYLAAWPLALLFGCSWLAWGALGSGLDSLLNLVSALLFGLAAGAVTGHFLFDALEQSGAGPGWNMTLGGFVIHAGLAVMSSALGFNGLQLLLTIALPATGWAAWGSSRLGRDRAAPGWLTLSILVALTAAAPMLFVDPDELALVLNMGSRDVFAWSLYATAATAAAGYLAGFVMWLLRNSLSRWSSRRTLGAATGALGMAAVIIYFVVGQPGFYGERLYVVFRDQVDVSAAAQIDDYAQRRQYVYDTLVQQADTTQADIRKVLDLIHVHYTPYYLVNAIEVDGGPLLRLWLNARPEVDRVLDSPRLRPLPAPIPPASGEAAQPSRPQWNLVNIGADRVWRELGVTGKGIVVGQSDSGAQFDHPELRSSYRGGEEHDYNWFDPWNHTTQPTDIGGHGTHTLGSILGQTVGVAPGAQWYGCVNLARNLANPALYLDCMQFMLAPFPLGGDPLRDGKPELGAHVINNSWGCPNLEGCDPNALVDATRALRAAGVFVVVSAGNEGDKCGSIQAPLALYDDVFSVGAVDASGKVAFFSSRGPVTADGSRRVKPDILAPGVGVLSAFPGGTYSYSDGTSMAGPHVVGVVALIWSANPGLIGDIERTEQILIETARPYDYARHGVPRCGDQNVSPDNAVGYGVVDAYAAVERALAMR